MKLSFVIPVFNESESMNILYSEIIENVSSLSQIDEYEIIFIDDGSDDDSFLTMKAISEKDLCVKIIKFRRNFGKSSALNTGFKNATGDIIITLDSDLQDDPKEISSFIEKINEGFDIVSGWKMKRNDKLLKRITSKIFNKVVSIAFRFNLKDHNSGFKAYKKHVIKELDIYGELHRYIPALAISKGFKITEIPVNHRKRIHGKSKFGSERFIRGFLDLLTVKLVTTFNRSPLYLFGGIGTVLTSSGILLGLYLTILRTLKLTYLSNRPLLFLSMLLIIVGLQFVSIGLIGELLVNQSRKLNRDDTVSIEEKINL